MEPEAPILVDGAEEVAEHAEDTSGVVTDNVTEAQPSPESPLTSSKTDPATQLEIMRQLVADAQRFAEVREREALKKCETAERDIMLLQRHAKNIERYMKRLAELHSQVEVAEKYDLSAAARGEILQAVIALARKEKVKSALSGDD